MSLSIPRHAAHSRGFHQIALGRRAVCPRALLVCYRFEGVPCVQLSEEVEKKSYALAAVHSVGFGCCVEVCEHFLVYRDVDSLG